MKYLVVILLFVSQARAEDHCAKYFAEGADQTESYLAYLDALVGEQMIQVQDLSPEDPLANPLRLAQSATSRMHAREIDQYLRSGEVSADEVTRWIVTNQDVLGQIVRQRNQAQHDTRAMHKMVFNRVTGGYFHRLYQDDLPPMPMRDSQLLVEHVEVEDFEMMATPVTQEMWEDVMGFNPAAHQGESDLPIENITFPSALEFANRMSREAGLEPYYDVSGRLGKAEEGTLEVYAVRLNVGDRTGYRVPTAIEYDYVASNRGTGERGWFPGLNWENIGDYAWTAENSGLKSHAVRTRRPLELDGNEFHDLLGNVSEYTSAFTTYCAHYKRQMEFLFTHCRETSNTQRPMLGFRLARNLKAGR